jgi:hypothetical protein
MPLREFVDESGVAWLAWSTVPRSGANVRAQYAGGWLTFQLGTGEDRRRLIPVPDAWEAASEDELRAYLRRARPMERVELLSGTAEAAAQRREEEAAETRERDRAEDSGEQPVAPSTDDRGALHRIREILHGIRIGREGDR